MSDEESLCKALWVHMFSILFAQVPKAELQLSALWPPTWQSP